MTNYKLDTPIWKAMAWDSGGLPSVPTGLLDEPHPPSTVKLSTMVSPAGVLPSQYTLRELELLCVCARGLVFYACCPAWGFHNVCLDHLPNKEEKLSPQRSRSKTNRLQGRRCCFLASESTPGNTTSLVASKYLDDRTRRLPCWPAQDTRQQFARLYEHSKLGRFLNVFLISSINNGAK